MCPIKSCDGDPILTVLLKYCLDTIVPLITAVVNDSITKRVFLDDLREAFVTPFLKKANLNLVDKKL